MKFISFLFEKDNEDEELQLNPKLKTGLFLLLWAVILVFSSIIYIAKSKDIYFWDNANYWNIARSIAQGSLSGHFWSGIYESVGNADYNYVAGLLSALAAYLFGGSRVVYVAGIVLMYLVPSVALMYALAKKLGTRPYLTVTLIMLICPVITKLTFLGFADMGGLLICLICYYLYFVGDDRKQSVPKSVLKGAAIGALLVFAMIWRGYYAYFAVSFITAMIADVILFKRKWYGAAAVILTAATLLTFCFRDFLINILLTDYASAYSGYKYAFGTDFKLITRYFGLIFLLLIAAISVYIGVKKKDYRPVTLWLQIIACAAMFMAARTHGQQHLLLYIPSAVMLLILAVKYAEGRRLIALLSVLAVIQTVNVCIPRGQSENIQDIPHYALVPDFSMLPSVREDADEILSLKNSLDSIVGEGERLGVLASSFAFNEDILKNAAPSLNAGEGRTDYIIQLPMADSRGADLSELYEVSYMLVAYPAQTHPASGNQTVITEGVDSFTYMTDFAAAFEAVEGSETRIGDITLKLFRRTGEVTQAEKAQFEERLYK